MTLDAPRPTVRGVGPDPRDPALVVVSLSDGRNFRVDAAAALGAGCTVGAVVDQALEESLEAQEERTAARARALRYLEARERSRFEVEQRLRRYGYDEALVSDTLRWLEGLGYVDDRRFAEWFARAREGSAWGPRRLREELRRKGVPRTVVEETVGAFDLTGEAEERTIAELVALVERRFGRELATDRERAERRITGFLGRRGHDWDTIRSVLARAAPADESVDADGG